MGGIRANILGTINSVLPDFMALPKVLIIGAQKAATSSLYNLLIQHPDINRSIRKEIHFFDQKKRFSKGKAYYKRQFLPNIKNKLTLEATPRYMYIPEVPVRIKNMLGKQTKFIVCLRDPGKRAYSAYNMYKSLVENKRFIERIKMRQLKNNTIRTYSTFYENKRVPSFKEIVQLEFEWIENKSNVIEPSIVRRGFYKEQIENWLKHFPIENFLFLSSDLLKSPDENNIYNKLESFLGIKEDILPKIKIGEHHKRRYTIRKEDMDVIDNLDLYYSTKNKGLNELIGFVPY